VRKSGGFVDWRVRLRRDELRLRRIVQRLGGLHGDAPEVLEAREKEFRALAHTITSMRTLIDDCLSGRSEHERSVMEYRVRIEFPLYSHIGTLTALSSKHLDWF
jgi:hypothetical protein